MRISTLLQNLFMRPRYQTIETLIGHIDEPYQRICMQILTDNRARFEATPGATYNHQAWRGGYIDHITDGMNYAFYKYRFDSSFGRPLPFSRSDALLIFFLHDLEKPWRIEVLPDGSVRNKPGLDSKEAYQDFREAKLLEYELTLTPYLHNALTYVEGEVRGYKDKERAMNELASFCHTIDNWCARVWYNYPKATGDEWLGAKRFRTT